MTVLAPGASPRTLKLAAQPDGVLDAAWTADGTALVVAYVQADHAHLAIVTPGGAPATVADLGQMDVAGLTVSPDGTRAAFAGTDEIDF